MSDALDDVINAASDEVEVDLSGASDYEYLQTPGWQRVKITKVATKDKDGKQLLSKAGAPKVIWYAEISTVLTATTVDDVTPKVGMKVPLHHTNINGAGAGKTKDVLKAIGQFKEGEKVTLKPSRCKDQELEMLFVKNGIYLNVDKVRKVSDASASAPPATLADL